MKILKPGKVEQRKFVCPSCECEFMCAEIEDAVTWDADDCRVRCPICRENLLWCDGEPYEEITQSDEERMIDLLSACRIDMVSKWAEVLADYLIRNRVTFKEG